MINERIAESSLRDLEAGAFEETEARVLFPRQNLSVGGVFSHEVIRAGRSMGLLHDHNKIVNEGLNDLLQTYLGNGTQIPTWYVGIFEGNYTPVAGDAAASIATNSTESIAYDEATRPEWVDAAAAAQSISNTASKAVFTINATKTIYGALLVSTSTKAGAVGKLFSASRFATSRSVVAADQLLITYTVQASSTT